MSDTASTVGPVMHPDQIGVSVDVVGRLLADQFPALVANRPPITPVVGPGTVNAIFRVGDEVTVRFPLQPGPGAEQLRDDLVAEQAALAELAQVSPIATPHPLGVGDPGHGHPLPWSVQTWLDGRDGWRRDTSTAGFADDLVALIATFRAVDTRGRAFSGRGRGGSIAEHGPWVETCLHETARFVDAETLGRLTLLWHGFRSLTLASTPPVMSHGDLIPGNVLVAGGRLVGLLDGGGFGPADRSLDLVSVWHLLGSEWWDRVREGLGSDDEEWQRGRAWAFEQAMGLWWYYRSSNPEMSRLGERTLRRLLVDEPR
jgi:aminoglycoside phosphotransferase (APT) family kinase protein